METSSTRPSANIASSVAAKISAPAPEVRVLLWRILLYAHVTVWNESSLGQFYERKQKNAKVSYRVFCSFRNSKAHFSYARAPRVDGTSRNFTRFWVLLLYPACS